MNEKASIEDTQTSERDPPRMAARRQRSTINFPYLSLEVAEEVAVAIYERCGFSPCEIDELAAQMGHNISGAFRQKTSAARTFGAVEKDGRSTFTLTSIGRKLAVSDTRAEGRVEAFLAVPLYAEIFTRYRGQSTPPPKALENAMEKLGVANKQTDRARQAFERSAQYAGFFDLGPDKLVKPRLDTSASSDELSKESSVSAHGVGRERDAPRIDPIIQGLLDRLPPSGSIWPESDRNLWIELLQGSFKLIYKTTGGDEDAD